VKFARSLDGEGTLGTLTDLVVLIEGALSEIALQRMHIIEESMQSFHGGAGMGHGYRQAP
jgi:hypothetical protein